ncbi:MAG: 2-succinyl-5-enolpyruvyl-6-hydroxy-3-cyclohexene-1-carboxylic-acid synthase [Candidatus Sericytochromatia bacterium]|nr:2-succinyl-5-enolpyruvyl-6-hydroxy-3-cyclohexene-1-carboxylic-acid synthase [Candidatus Sericytochromatia bacterium]
MSSRGLTNLNWAHSVLDTLVGQGVRHLVLSPGSRSTPLALAAHRHPRLSCEVVLDERVAGFVALGMARVLEAPVALVCTSGTAAANYHPALAEASAWGVPLVAVTADRPPRLRGVGAAQTINQVGLYGPTTSFLELPVPDPEALPQACLRLGLAASSAIAAGRPLHVNVPFDEPLAPTPEELAGWVPPAPQPLQRPSSSGRVPEATLTWLVERLRQAQRPVLLAGPGAGDRQTAVPLLRWAARLGLPVLADVGSGLRGAGSDAFVLHHADLFLRPPLSRAFEPDLVLRVGRQMTSKAIATWAAGSGAECLTLWPDALGRDPDAAGGTLVLGDLADLFVRWGEQAAEPTWSAWSERWLAQERRTASALTRVTPAPPLEAAAVRAALAALPEGAQCVLSNSMPIRHADAYAGAGSPGMRVHVIRGANGIDGVTSFSLGVALASRVPTLLVTGDLAFLHDVGALALLRRLTVPLVILVLDNRGGLIFHHLPIAEAAPDFETLFATPHDQDLAAVAAGFGLPARWVTTASEVGYCVGDALSRPGPTVWLVPSERQAAVADHRRFLADLQVGGTVDG